jgi:hypothetical protein
MYACVCCVYVLRLDPLCVLGFGWHGFIFSPTASKFSYSELNGENDTVKFSK